MKLTVIAIWLNRWVHKVTMILMLIRMTMMVIAISVA